MGSLKTVCPEVDGFERVTFPVAPFAGAGIFGSFFCGCESIASAARGYAVDAVGMNS